jgi:hypothetical protein
MFIVTALVAVASLAARWAAMAGDVTTAVFAIAAIPILLGAAIGTLAGRIGLATSAGARGPWNRCRRTGNSSAPPTNRSPQMALPCKNRTRTLVSCLLVATLLACLINGCAKGAEKDSAGGRSPGVNMKELAPKLAKLDSANGFLTVADLEKFRPGRLKSDLLNDVRWRADSVTAADCEGKSITSIYYTLLADGSESNRSEGLQAMFAGDKFEKLIRWLPYTGPNPMKAGDCCGWLTQAMKSEAVSIADLKKEMKSITAPSEHIDPGLTAVYLAMRVLRIMPGPGAPPSEKDYLRNAALRDQFNAARLNIGMTESEVEAVLKAKPLESGKVEAGDYRIYGSNESVGHISSISGAFPHFSNVLVVFRQGTAIAIESVPAGIDWRRKITEAFADLPKPTTTDSSGNSK